MDRLWKRASRRATLVGLRAGLVAVNAGLAALIADGAIDSFSIDLVTTAGLSAAAAAMDVVKQSAEHWQGIVDTLLSRAREVDTKIAEGE